MASIGAAAGAAAGAATRAATAERRIRLERYIDPIATLGEDVLDLIGDLRELGDFRIARV